MNIASTVERADPRAGASAPPDSPEHGAAGGAAGSLAKAPPAAPSSSVADWVPVLHRRVDGWDFTVMYSMTHHAREAGKTQDWVVVHFQREGRPEGRCTVVTDTRGSSSRRVVLGLGE